MESLTFQRPNFERRSPAELINNYAFLLIFWLILLIMGRKLTVQVDSAKITYASIIPFLLGSVSDFLLKKLKEKKPWVVY